MTSLLTLFNNRYNLKDLVVPQDQFRARLEGYRSRMDETRWMPGRPSGERQWESFLYTASWGHNHDFGEGLVVSGRMENRHVRLAERFMNLGVLPEDLSGLRVLALGCYTGGDALLLAAMGADVDACEEHPLYAEIAAFLSESFNAKVKVYDDPFRHLFGKGYDLVYSAGVIYHQTDPLGSLDDWWARLRPGGKLLVESMILEGREGPFVWYQGRQHPGYNWFVPTPLALTRMMEDREFVDVACLSAEGERGYFTGRRPDLEGEDT